jgi:hypothetical protein
MIGNHVEDQAKAMSLEVTREKRKTLLAPYLWVELAMITNIVTVLATSATLENGRRVAITDPQFTKVRDNRSGLLESEALIELKTIGCSRNSLQSEPLIDLAYQPRHDFDLA